MVKPVEPNNQHEVSADAQFSSVRDLFTERNQYLSDRVTQGIEEYLSGTDKRAAFNKDTLIRQYAAVEIPAVGQSFKDYMDTLENQIIPSASHLASARYLGHMTSPLPTFIPEIGRLIQSLNQNMVKMETSRGLTILERQVLALIHKEIYGFDQAFYDASANDFSSTLGIFASGGTLANVSAMWAAWKNSSYKNNGRHDNLVIIGSALMHYSFDKAAEILGVELVRLPVNNDNVVNVQDMQQAIDDCAAQNKKVIALVGIAGTTDFGSIDPLAEICRLGKEHGIYVHIDAAWGGGFILSDDKATLLAGIEQADSVTIDGHKQLMTPIGCGLLLFRTPELSKAIAHYAPYAVREKSLDQGRYTLEGTRPANVLYLHACLNLIGRNGYAEMFRHAMSNAAYMAKAINDSDAFELMTPQRINIFTYRYIPPVYRNKQLSVEDNLEINRINELLQKKQRAIGNAFVSRTLRSIGRYGDQKLVLLRVILLNPLTTTNDIDFVLNEQIAIARTLET